MPHHVDVHHSYVFHLLHPNRRGKNSLDFDLFLATHELARFMVGLFLPLFLYNIFNFTLFQILLFFSVHRLIASFMMPIATKFISVVSPKYCMLISSFLVLVFYAIMSASQVYDPRLIFLAPVVTATYTALYWQCYHLFVSRTSTNKFRGRQIALIHTIITMASSVAPVIGGYFATDYPLYVVYCLAGALILVSNVPLFLMDDIKTGSDFSFKKFFKYAFNNKVKKALPAFIAEGIVGSSTFVFWPLFLFFLLDESYTAIGLVTGLGTITMCTVMTYIGKKLKDSNRDKIMMLGASSSGGIWLIRMLIVFLSAINPFFIWIIDSIYKMTWSIIYIPYSSIYENMFASKASESQYAILYYNIVVGLALMIGFWLNYAIILALPGEPYDNIYLSFLLPMIAIFFMPGLSKAIKKK
jgi:hypothetical protein